MPRSPQRSTRVRSITVPIDPPLTYRHEVAASWMYVSDTCIRSELTASIPSAFFSSCGVPSG